MTLAHMPEKRASAATFRFHRECQIKNEPYDIVGHVTYHHDVRGVHF